MPHYTFKRILSWNFGLKPNIVICVYTAVIKPILTYGALASWPAFKKQVRIPSRREWRRGIVGEEDTTSIYIDGTAE